MNQKAYVSILIPDGESHLAIQVIICLSRVKKYRLHVLSSLRHSEIRFSRYVSSFRYYPTTTADADWVHAINTEVRDHDIDVVMPVFETGIRRILVNKSLLEFPERLVPVPRAGSFDIAIDKWKLYEHCSKIGIPCPKTWLFNGSDGSRPDSLPVVVKPTTGFGGGMGISLLREREDWEAFSSVRRSGPHSYLIQEYIEGLDFSCSVLCLEGEILAYTIQRSESPQTGHFGPQMVYRFEKNKKILELSAALLKSLHWSGIASIDLRYDPLSDTYNILEVNTRFWRSLVGSLYAGVNFPDLLARLTLEGKLCEIPSYKEIRFYDLKGFAGLLRRKPSLLFNTELVTKSTSLKMIWADPMPYAHKFINRTKNIIKRKF